jgi:hypothetical protein
MEDKLWGSYRWRKKRSMRVGNCVAKARKYIDEQGMCLLLFDVKGFKKLPDELKDKLPAMANDLNSRFRDYFPENSLLGIPGRIDKGFKLIGGDGFAAGINNPDIIPEIRKYQKTKYPDIPVYWGVAKDCYDKKGISLVVPQ